MNLDLRNGVEGLSKNGVEKRIDTLMTQIEGEYKFRGNTLKDLFGFKLSKGKQEVLNNSGDFKEELIKEIGEKALSKDILKSNNEELSFAEYGVLANKIIEIDKLTREVQEGIQGLRAELLNDSLDCLSTNNLLTKRLYSPETLARIENPQNFSDNLLGLGIGLGETITVSGKFCYDIGKGLALSIYDLIQMIRGKAKYDGSVEI